jgi:hypothetical protein
MPKHSRNKSVPTADTIGDFFVVPLILNNDSDARHYLYFKEHNGPLPKGLDSPEGDFSALFVANLPVFENEVQRKLMRDVFGGDELVQDVLNHSLRAHDSGRLTIVDASWESGIESAADMHHPSRSVVFILFRSDASRKCAIADLLSRGEWRMPSNRRAPSQVVSLNGFIERYKVERPPLPVLQTIINKWMAEYDAMVQREAEEREAERNVADAEGFVTVSSKGKKKRFSDGHVKVTARHASKQDINGTLQTTTDTSSGGRKKKKRATGAAYSDFYAFQKRESMEGELRKLKEEFENAKGKIMERREAKAFAIY